MFIELTPFYYRSISKYYNINEIRSFEANKEGGTKLNLSYGVELVTESPKEIMEMLKGEQK